MAKPRRRGIHFFENKLAIRFTTPKMNGYNLYIRKPLTKILTAENANKPKATAMINHIAVSLLSIVSSVNGFQYL